MFMKNKSLSGDSSCILPLFLSTLTVNLHATKDPSDVIGQNYKQKPERQNLVPV